MQLGLSTYSFPWAIGVKEYLPPKPLTVTDLVQWSAGHNIHFVQIGDNLPLHSLSVHALNDLKALANNLQVQIEVGTRRLNKENTLHYLSIAEQFGSPFLRMVIDDAGFYPDEQEVIDCLQQVLPHLRSSGIVLAIENHDRFPAASLERIIQQTDPQWVGICLDTANSLGAGEGIKEVAQVLAPYTINLHVKDFTIKRLPHKMGFTVAGCAAGEGMLNIPWLIEEIEQHKKCRTATLEVWSQPEATIEETIEKEKQWVEKSIHYLKKLLA